MGKIYHKKVILVDVISPDLDKWEAEKRLEELESLVQTFGGMVVLKIIQKRGVPDYENYIGKGKVEELCELGKEKGAELVIVNNILKPRQIYNLDEKFRKVDMKTWDRIDLILKIFDKHAQSTKAKLQIELAGIRHMGPRIYNMGLELSRQAGAVGLRAGGGEANIEMMKRHLQKQELNIMKKLKHYETIEEGHLERRKRKNFKTVSIVGYTNAGKSSLLNAITGKGAYVADKLFATLDTRIGKLYIPAKNHEKYEPGKEILVSDTIGFIRDLPPELIQAFKSTLLETIEADLLLHVIDISDDDITKKIEVVEEILEQLGVSDKPKIYVFNKIDLLPKKMFEPVKPKRVRKGLIMAGEKTSELLGWTAREEVEKEKQKRESNDPKKLQRKYKEFNPVFISAHEKKGLNELIEAIENIG